MNVSIGKIKLGAIPRVVGVVSDKNISTLSDASVRQIDILEVRIDMFTKYSESHIERTFRTVKTRFDKPVIATVRSSREGGYIKMDDTRRYGLFELVQPFSDASDVEIRSGKLLKKVVSLYRSHNKPVIGSYHNFLRTPDIPCLTRISARAREYGVDIVKIAVKAVTRNDLARLAFFTIKHRKDGLVTISLGDMGLISRIFNPLAGSLLTFGHLGIPSAPGQVSALDIANYLRTFDPGYREASLKKRST